MDFIWSGREVRRGLVLGEYSEMSGVKVIGRDIQLGKV